jgi:CRISPR/Cas system CSM-associated protein Csm3 (group 7 of RAMP superfamily)
VKLRITIVTEVTLDADSIYGTPEDYQTYKDDPEMVYECFVDEIHETAAKVENWKIEELP